MKVAIVVNGLGTGGTERSLTEMLPGYVARGVEPVIVCFYRRSEGVQDSVIAAGYDVRFLAASSTLTRARELRRLVTGDGIDLIHTQLFDANMASRLAGIRLGTPVLTSLVNTNYDRTSHQDREISRYKLEVVRLLDGFTSRHLTDHFHAVSQAVKDVAVGALGIDPGRVTVIGRGRDPARMGRPSAERRMDVRDRLGLGPDVPVLVTAGRQEHQKGHVYLLRAMAELRSRVPEAVLLLAGRRGNASDDLDHVYQDLELEGSVRLLGHRDDVPDLLAASDVFVLPSLSEGIAGAVIEAMALGLPVVASDIPAMHEVLVPGENALLVPVRDPSALADAMERLLGNEDMRHRFGDRSSQRFAEAFTLDAVVDRMVDLYRWVVAAAR